MPYDTSPLHSVAPSNNTNFTGSAHDIKNELENERGLSILFGSRMRTLKMTMLIRDPIKGESTCPGGTHYAKEVLVNPICTMKQLCMSLLNSPHWLRFQ